MAQTALPEGAQRCGRWGGQPLYFLPAGVPAAAPAGYYFWTGSQYNWLASNIHDLRRTADEQKRTLLLDHPGRHTIAHQSDARQSSDKNPPTTRFRPRFRALDDAEKNLHDAIKAKADELLSLYAEIGPLRALLNRAEPMQDPHVPASTSGRYVALAVTDLESSVMWAVKALTT